ncbi:hypothetical protein N008_05075 [Hymenobacter sp. APR13]|nr:hypothetical protein N008_05075 [Hymenobacter sp. APR13]
MLLLGRGQLGAGHTEAVLLTAGGIYHNEIFAGAAGCFHGQLLHLLLRQQLLQQLAGGPTGRKHRHRVGPQPAQRPAHVDAAAAGLELGRGAAQLLVGDDVVGSGAFIDGRVQGKRDDAGHKRG